MRIALLVVLLVLPGLSAADGKSRAPLDPGWQAECGSCHAPYSPRFLPAESWRRILGDLQRHFGTDASVDGQMLQKLSQYAAGHAGRGAPPPGAEPRITETAWFRREHRRLDAASDCVRCHIGAAEGDFSEHRIRIPK